MKDERVQPRQFFDSGESTVEKGNSRNVQWKKEKGCNDYCMTIGGVLCSISCFHCVYIWMYLRICSVCYGECNGNPLQYSCLENPKDGGAWYAAVHGVAKGRT